MKPTFVDVILGHEIPRCGQTRFAALNRLRDIADLNERKITLSTTLELGRKTIAGLNNCDIRKRYDRPAAWHHEASFEPSNSSSKARSSSAA